MKILIVDDDQFILELLSNVLTREGHEAQISTDTISAMELLDNNHHFDLVITDIVMPGQDGTKLAQHVKSLRRAVPVIAITGGVENALDDYAHYADMFSDETLAKPFKPDELMRAVERVTASVC